MPPSRPSKDKDTKKPRVLANRYEIIKKLGTGNFGAAFLCNDRKDKSNEKKVLKEISVGDLEPNETLDAVQEAKLLSKLNHPCIVKYHDRFIDGEFFCIVTEYCEGGDLDCKIAEYRKNKKTFSEQNVMDWFVQLILAIQYLHSRKVLHRDLKTRNIFLKRNKIKIGDFGISRILMGTADLASTFTGTPYYMSPEVLKHEGYNSKSDIWAVGCILYELCVLDHAFNGQSLMAVMYKIVEGDIPDIPKPYSKDLNKLFKLMLNKDLDTRPTAMDILKLPFVNNCILKMKDTFFVEMRSRQTSGDDGAAERESKEIMESLRAKSHVDEIQKLDDEDINMQNLPPRERMRLKKIEKANAERERLNEAAKINLAENIHRKETIQNALSKSSLPAWIDGTGEGKGFRDALRKATTTSRSGDQLYDEESTLKSNSMKSYKPFLNTTPNPIRINYEEEFLHDTVLSRTVGSNSLYNNDERPLTPLKDKMVYDKENSSLDFDNGIPDKPLAAETFYEQFNDFEPDDGDRDYSSEDDSNSDEAAETVVHRKPSQYDSDSEDSISGTVVNKFSDYKLLKNTIEAAENTGDLDAYIDCLQVALDKPDQEGTITVEDDVDGAFGPAARERKIKNLKVDCIKMLGPECFTNAYEYLKNARYSDSSKTEENIIDGLRSFVPNPSDCFLVDQLLFLEEQAGHFKPYG